jgi:phage I-like protein
MNAAINAPSIALASASASTDDKPTWVQVARAGNYRGYARGEQPFEFTGVTFDQIVANLHNSPAFKRGPNGMGTAPVIAWDYHHASEQPAAMTGEHGAPATGWVYDAEKRIGADGVAELWALTRFLEPARTQVRSGQYRWASVSVILDAIDPVTGRSIGAVLTSIALTNSPFIEGMQPLAASRNALARGNKPVTFKARITSADKPTLDVSMQHGANPLLKVLAHVRAAQPRLSHDDAFAHAVALSKSHHVIA